MLSPRFARRPKNLGRYEQRSGGWAQKTGLKAGQLVSQVNLNKCRNN